MRWMLSTMTRDYNTIRMELKDGVPLLTMNNPPVNQLSRPFVEEIKDALEAAFKDDAVKAVIFTGTEKNFIAGADITEIQKMTNRDSIFSLVIENNRFLNSILVGEGVNSLIIEKAVLDFGFPMGPFTLIDLTGFDIRYHVIKNFERSFGERWKMSPIEELVY
jgi:hypothetical protein